jgi:cyclic pyranopterin phosphate synthase
MQRRQPRGSVKTAVRKSGTLPHADPHSKPALTHLNAGGQAHMVEIGDKPISTRVAIARARVRMLPATLRVLRSGRAAKGDVLAVARIAGIQAAKRTPELIPLCHAIALTGSEIQFTTHVQSGLLDIEARICALDRTGAEMEALTAAAVAALTVYDMLKAIDRGMCIEQIALHEKRGGKTGTWLRARGATRAKPDR